MYESLYAGAIRAVVQYGNCYGRREVYLRAVRLVVPELIAELATIASAHVELKAASGLLTHHLVKFVKLNHSKFKVEPTKVMLGCALLFLLPIVSVVCEYSINSTSTRFSSYF